MISRSYPGNCIRGIDQENCITEEGNIAQHAFNFKDVGRPDHWMEVSINWEDDHNAIGFTLNQIRRDGERQFLEAVTLSRSQVDDLKERLGDGNLLSYERQAEPDNSYHGNLLLKSDVSKHLKNLAQAGLALVSRRIPREEKPFR